MRNGGEPMAVKQIETKTFFFDAKLDYLPHFRTNMIDTSGCETVVDILKKVAEQERGFTFSQEEPLLRINGTWINGELGLKEAVEVFGTEWKIEPISGYRAVKDLIIDDSDFIAKHKILAPFAKDEEDFVYYKSLKNIYYASGTLPYNQDYFGDALFVYAHYLTQKYPDQTPKILDAIDHQDGIWLYEAECNRYPLDDSDAKIKELLLQLPETVVEGYTSERMAYYRKAEDALCRMFDVERDEDAQLETIVERIGLQRVKSACKHPFGDFKVAFYSGSFACEDIDEVQKYAKDTLEAIGAKQIDFSRATYADGFDIVDTHPDIAFKKAGNIVLDAFDSGADILVVDNRESHFMFDQNKLALEKAVGRDIRIPILNIAQMVALAVGITDKEKIGLDKHKIVPDFI
jgi:succinate dehydrogenase/fumarate reductase-like Fe-S protein